MENKTLAIYDTAAAALVELESTYGVSEIDVTTKSGFTECKSTATKFQKLRTGVEATRKEANADAQAHIKNVNGQAASIQDRIAPLEDRFASPVKEYKDKFKKLISDVDNIPDICQGRGSVFISEKIQWLESINGDHLFETKERKDLNASLFTANDKVSDLFTQAVTFEREEQERKEREDAQRIDSCINEIKSAVMDAFGKDSFEIGRVINSVHNTVIDESFGEKQYEAEQVRGQVLAQLEQMEKMAIEQENKIVETPAEEQIEIAESLTALPESEEILFNDCIADSEPEKEANSTSLTLKSLAMEKMLQLTCGDIEVAEEIIKEIELGNMPGVTANF